MKRSRKMTLALFIAIGIVGLLLIIGSMNVGGDIVRREAAKAVAEVLGADLTIQGVTGNPIRGYRLSDISLKKKEDVLLSAGALGVKVNLMSVFSGNPRLSQVTIDGIEADGEKLAREIAALDLKGEGGEIPVEAVTIRNGKVRTPWGEASIAKTDLVLKADSVKADLDIAMNNVPIKGPINLRKGKDDLELKGLDLKVGDGRISAKGAILPSLSLKGEMEKLDVGQVVQFWPQLPVDGYKGLFSSTISIGGLWNDPVLEGRLSFYGTSLAGYPVQAIDSDWKYGAFRLSLENLKAKALALPLSGRAAFAFAPGKVPSMDILMEGKDASLEELKGTVPALASVKGRVDSFSVAVKGTLATLSGNIDLKADQVEAYGQQLKNTVAHVVFKGSGATIQGSSSLEGGSLALSGSVDQLQRAPRLNVLLKARSIDVGKIIASLPKPPKITPKGSVSADIGVKGSMADPRVDGTVWSDRMAYGEEALNDLNTAFVFHKDRVTLSSARGRWRNIPITGRGTIAGVSKAAPSLDLSFQAAGVNPENFESFFPDLKSYELRGSITAVAQVEGTTAAPEIKLSIQSPRLNFMEQGHVANLSLSTDLALKEGVPKEVNLALKAATAGFAGVGAENLTARIDATKDVVTLSQARASLGKGEIAGTGTVKLHPEASADLDLSFEMKEGDLAAIAKAGKLPYSLGGSLSGKVSVKGKSDNPSIAADFSSPKAVFSGFTFSNLSGALEGNMERMALKKFTASAGGGTITTSGSFNLKKEAPEAILSLTGKGLDVASLTAGLPEAAKFKPSGAFDVNFDGTIAGSASEGKGAVTASSLSIAGLKMTNISYPFTLQGMNLSIANAHASFYGGTVAGKGDMNLAKGAFSQNITVENVDIDPLLQDAAGGLEGHIVGKAKGNLSLTGTMTKGLAFSGKGELHVGEGAVTDFKAVKTAASLYGQSSIRFASVEAPFRLETKRVILENGKATAFPEDSLYKILKASGPIGFDTTLALQCQGNVNIQVLNALFGGVAGALGAGTATSLEDILKGALTGAKSGLEKADFRDVSFNLGGTIEKPSVSNVKIAPAPQAIQQTTPSGTAPTAVEEATAPPKEATGETQKKPENLLEGVIQEGLKNILKKE